MAVYFNVNVHSPEKWLDSAQNEFQKWEWNQNKKSEKNQEEKRIYKE